MYNSTKGDGDKRGVENDGSISSQLRKNDHSLISYEAGEDEAWAMSVGGVRASRQASFSLCTFSAGGVVAQLRTINAFRD